MTQEFSSDMTQSEASSVAVCSVVPGKYARDDLNQYTQA